MIKLILEEAGGIQSLDIDKDELTIGRTADNAVRVQDALSSRKHCKIEKTKDGFVVEDLKSRNGTTLNGQPLVERKILAIGDRIAIGQSTIHFGQRLEGAGAKKGPAAPPAPAAASARTKRTRFALKGVEGERTGKQWGIAAFPYTIGRKKNLSLVIDEEEVSPEHCMLVEDEGTVHVVDLNSASGTFVDGQKVKGRAKVKPNSILGIGKTKIKFKDLAGKGADLASDDETADPAAGQVTQAKAPPAQAKKPAPAVAVAEEVTDLDGLGDDDDDSAKPDPARTPAPTAEFDPAATPTTGLKRPGKPSGKQTAEPPAVAGRDKTGRKPRPAVGVQTPEAPVPVAAATFDEGAAGIATTDLSSKRIVDQAEERGAFGAIAIVLVVLALLGAAFPIGMAALANDDPDPSPTDNKVEDWSFEQRGRGWAGKFQIVASDVGYGKLCARIDATPESKDDPLRQAEPKRLDRDTSKALSVHAALRTEGSNVAGVLAIEWTDESQPSWKQIFYAAVSKDLSMWTDVGSLAVPPANATHARVFVQAAPIGGGGGSVLVDRVTLQDASLPAEGPPKLSGAGFNLTATPRGVLTIAKGDRPVARVMAALAGPAGERAVPLASQDAMDIVTTAGDPGDGGILAEGTLLDVTSGERIECAASVHLQGEALRLTWEIPKKQLPDGRKVRIAFDNVRLNELSPVQLTCADGTNKSLDELLAKGPVAIDGIYEIAFGKAGPDQTSLSVQRPLSLEVEKTGDSTRIELSGVPEVRGDNAVIGFDLKKGSRLDEARLRSMLDAADKARKEGRLEDARKLNLQIANDFKHYPEVAALAQKRAGDLAGMADRLLASVTNAAQDAEDLLNPDLVVSARHWVEVLEKAFPGASQIQKAKDAADHADKMVKSAGSNAREKAAMDLFEQGKRQRAARARTASTIYKYVIEYYPETKAAVQAKTALDAMPQEYK